jgi:hypothetical protein
VGLPHRLSEGQNFEVGRENGQLDGPFFLTTGKSGFFERRTNLRSVQSFEG